MNYVPGIGRIGAKLLVLGDHPRAVDNHATLPFQGGPGRELDKLFYEAGIKRQDCWLTNACKYEIPPSHHKKKISFKKRAWDAGIDLDEQFKELHQEISTVNPNCILALGGIALYSLIGKSSIQKYRGSILSSNGHKFVGTYNPAHLLHSTDSEIAGYWNRGVMLFDFKRAKEEAETPELILPQRHIEICRNAGQLWEFRNRYRNKKKVAADIEAARTCLPACMGIAFNSHHAMVVPFFNLEGYLEFSSSELAQMWIILNDILTEHDVVGQNFKYDDDKIRRIGFKIRNLSDDLLLKSFTISPELPKNLAFNTSIYTREPFYKDEGMYEGSLEDLFIGCGRDACCTFEINEKMDKDLEEMGLVDWYNNFIMKLHNLYLDIESTGFRVDEKKRDELIEKYVKKSEQLQFEIFQMTGVDLNVNSPKQVYELLFDTLKLPPRPGTGEEELTVLLNNAKVNEPSKLLLTKILEKRRVDKTIGTYMMALPDYDGRMKTTYFLCLETGRTRTSQLEPPIRPRVEVRDFEGKKKNKDIGMAFQTMTKHGDIGHDVRSQFIPDEGEVFLQADSSQAEARVVFLLANDEQALKDIDEHDYHALTASWFFGGREEDYSKKILGYEHPIRFGGKTLRHACHLGASARRAKTTIDTDARKYKIDFTISEKDAARAIKIFHLKQPKIRQVFQNGVIEALGKNRQLISAVPFGVDSKIGGIRTFYERWGDELFRTAFSYIPQRTVSDNTKCAALRIKRRIPSIKIILEAHDALLFSIPEKLATEYAVVIRAEMERPIRFDTCTFPRRDLVIPCDIELGYNYMELKKFKNLPEQIKTKREELSGTERFIIR